jgi:hypothetical protein
MDGAAFARLGVRDRIPMAADRDRLGRRAGGGWFALAALHTCPGTILGIFSRPGDATSGRASLARGCLADPTEHSHLVDRTACTSRVADMVFAG